MKLAIRKGSKVRVMTGADKGREGTVLAVDIEKMRVRIEGVKMQTRHSKKDGLLKSEGYIHYSNVKLLEGAAPKKKAAKKSTKEKSA
ncbi:MAG TPA: KOW motif domain-containing protein [Bdellovibrionales bacterium]|nr:KOW motif domain-containing protein [Bdellovibrionales bacterium]